jgi:hypothetical protein
VWEDGIEGLIRTTQSRSYYKIRSYRADITLSDHIVATPYSATRHSTTPVSGQRGYTATSSFAYRLDNGVNKRMKYCSFYEPNNAPAIILAGTVDGAVSSVPSWVIAKATNSALNKLIDSDVNVGNFLGEAPQSIKMIASQAIIVLRAYRALRKGDFAAIPRILGVTTRKNVGKDAAGVWFSYKFGWLPLLEDIFGMQKAVMQQIERPSFGKVKSAVVTNLTVTPPSQLNIVETRDNTKGCEVGLVYKVDSPTLAGLNSLGLVNPLSVAWELLPLSFVVDWFIPVGHFINGLSAGIGLDFVTGYRTTFARGDFDYEMANTTYPLAQPPWESTDLREPWLGQVKASSMKREVLTTWPTPKLYIRMDLNINQIATLIGLITQRAK